MNNQSVKVFEPMKKYASLISIGLLAVALVCWVFSIFQAQMSFQIALSDLGLFSNLPISFFIACCLLVLSFFVALLTENRHRSILLLSQTFAVILFLNLTPSLIEGVARFSTGYSNYRAVDYISQNGHFASNLLWIHNWPGFSVLIASFVQITGIPAQYILLLYPTVFNVLFSVALLALFHNLFSDSKLLWLALWFILLGNWVGQDYFSMQSAALFVIVIIILLLFKLMKKQISDFKFSIIFYPLFFYIISSHFLSSLVILFVIFALYLTNYLRSKALLLSVPIMIAGWEIFNASYYLRGNLLPNLVQALDLSTIFQTNVTNRLSAGNSSHILASQVRIEFSIAMIAFAFIGILLMWKKKQFGFTEKRLFVILIGFLPLVVLFAYGGELFLRIYLLSLIPLAYFAAKALLRNRYLMVAGLVFFAIAAPSLTIIAHYGNEPLDYVPRSEISGSNFLFSSTTSGDIYGNFRYFTYYPNYRFISGAQLLSDNTANSLWSDQTGTSSSRFICISYLTVATYTFFVNDPGFVENLINNATASPVYNLVYSNPSFAIYASDT